MKRNGPCREGEKVDRELDWGYEAEGTGSEPCREVGKGQQGTGLRSCNRELQGRGTPGGRESTLQGRGKGLQGTGLGPCREGVKVNRELDRYDKHGGMGWQRGGDGNGREMKGFNVGRTQTQEGVRGVWVDGSGTDNMEKKLRSATG